MGENIINLVCMTTITIKENFNLSKTQFETVVDFLEEIEDYIFAEIITKNSEAETFDISLLEKKYLWK